MQYAFGSRPLHSLEIHPMKARYAVLLAILPIGQLIAQPVYNQADGSIQPGGSFVLRVGDWSAPPSTGEANATWDYAAWTSSSTVTSNFIAPTGPGSANATVSEVVGNSYAHYRSAPGVFQQVGFSSPGAQLTCSNAIDVYRFPLTFGTEYSDPYLCSGVNQGEAFTRTGTFNVVGTSWGTLVLPYGTFQNVLMVTVEQTHEDVFASDPEFPFEYAAYLTMFVKAGVHLPLLQIAELQNIPGPLLFYSRMLDQASIGIDEALSNAIGVELMPNPAADHVDVVFGVSAGIRSTIEVLDVTGKSVIMLNTGTMASGIYRETVDVSGLAAGSYTVRVTDAEGAWGTKRLVVQ